MKTNIMPTGAALARDWPEFLRIREAVQLSRLTKPKLYQLINSGKIRSLSIRDRGKMRGTRLVVADSLREFLMSCEEKGKGGAN